MEVDWRPLGELADVYGGLTGKNKSDFDQGNANYITYKNIFSNIEVNPEILEKVKVLSSEKQNKVQYGDILLTGSSEIADEAGMSSAVTTQFDEAVYLNSFSIGVRFRADTSISPEFSKYLFRSSFMRAAISKTASGVTRFNVSKDRLKKVLIPVLSPGNPKKSLEIQAEIVRILDAMTAHTAELTAELTARKKQYNYFRNKLLSFEDGEVEWKSLDEITYSIASGRNKNRSDVGKYKVYGSTGLIGYSDQYEYSEDVLLVARVGAYAGLVNAVSGKYDVSDNTLIVKPKEKWSIRFAFHQLTNMNLNKYAVGAGQPLVTGGLLKSLKVPFPSLSEQIRIANLLDKFEILTNNITEGLPREIELRQKQYTYYRDMLLSFPQPQEA